MAGRYLAFAACIALTGSTAHAEPGRHAKTAKKAKHKTAHADDVVVVIDDDAVAAARVADATDDDDIELDAPTRDDGDDDEAPVKLHAAAAPARAQEWNVAVGPYLWVSAVDASFNVGGMNLLNGVDFGSLGQHVKFGAEALAEARYGRFAVTGDLMYGAVGIDNGTTVGPLMVAITGTVSSALVDGAAGYMVLGGDDAVFSVEARGGIRYQRTAVNAQVGVAGATIAPAPLVFAASDAVAGGRIFLRPTHRVFFTASGDIGVFGASSSTWSAAADASVHLGSHVLVSLGYRTLTMDRSNVDVRLHGPRAAVQFLF